MTKLLQGVLVGFFVFAIGCEATSILVEAVQGPEKVEPKHVLADVPTLVMVEDPHHQLNNPGLARQVATTATHYLTFHEVLEEAAFIEPKKLVKLEAEMGEKWSQTPIDEIGRRLGAEQVVYAKINYAKYHHAGTLYRPEASIDVKVINAADGKRIWPNASPMSNPDSPQPGHEVKIKDRFVSSESRYVGDSTTDDLARRLADDAGLLIARLFYQWQKDAPGSSL